MRDIGDIHRYRIRVPGRNFRDIADCGRPRYSPAMARPKRHTEPQLVRFKPGTLKRLDAVRDREERAALMRRWIEERLETELHKRADMQVQQRPRRETAA
jgi:hypothetical protein